MAKRQKLDYNMDELTHNLKQSTGKGVDAFFSPRSPANQPKEKVLPDRKTPAKNGHVKRSPSLVRVAPSKTTKPLDTTPAKMVQGNHDAMTSRSHDITPDVTTSLSQEINVKLWREIIEETETHNSSLRMSAAEREKVEDVVRDLKRKYKIKTSMNEIARLGLLYLIYDFKKRGAQSIIHAVKKS